MSMRGNSSLLHRGRIAVTVLLATGMQAGCAETTFVRQGSAYPKPSTSPLIEKSENDGPPQMEAAIDGDTLSVRVFREKSCTTVARQEMVVDERSELDSTSARRVVWMSAGAAVLAASGVLMAVSHCPKVTGLAKDGVYYQNQCLPQDQNAQRAYNATGLVFIGAGVGLGGWALYDATRGGKERTLASGTREVSRKVEKCGIQPVSGVAVGVRFLGMSPRGMTDANGIARFNLLKVARILESDLDTPTIEISVAIGGSDKLERSLLVMEDHLLRKWKSQFRTEQAHEEADTQQKRQHEEAEIQQKRRVVADRTSTWPRVAYTDLSAGCESFQQMSSRSIADASAKEVEAYCGVIDQNAGREGDWYAKCRELNDDYFTCEVLLDELKEARESRQPSEQIRLRVPPNVSSALAKARQRETEAKQHLRQVEEKLEKERARYNSCMRNCYATNPVATNQHCEARCNPSWEAP